MSIQDDLLEKACEERDRAQQTLARVIFQVARWQLGHVRAREAMKNIDQALDRSSEVA